MSRPRTTRKSVISRNRAGAWLLSIALAATMLAGQASAIPIVEWDLANATGQSATVLTNVADLTASDITASAGLTPWSSTAEDGFIAASGWAPGAAADPSLYYEWSITADPGHMISYQSITLALFRGVQGAQHGAEQWDLHASTDGFASSNIALQTFDISASGVDEQIIFSGADISSIGTVAGTVTFRLYGYDYTSPTDFSGLGNDSGWLITGTGTNPVVDGMVIPEPGTGVLLLTGLLGLGLTRSRSRRIARR